MFTKKKAPKKMTAKEAERAVALLGKSKSTKKKIKPDAKLKKAADRLKPVTPGFESMPWEDKDD